MTELKSFQGILALIDAVNFTGQANRTDDSHLGEYSAYFQGKIADIARKHRFSMLKTLGDAVLIFGDKPGDLLEIMRDLFDRKKGDRLETLCFPSSPFS